MKSRISNGGVAFAKCRKSQKAMVPPTRECITPQLPVQTEQHQEVDFVRNCHDPEAAEAVLKEFVYGHQGTRLFIEETVRNLFRSKIVPASLFDSHSGYVTKHGRNKIKAASRKAWRCYLNTFCMGWEDKPLYRFPSVLLDREVLDFLMDAEAERNFKRRMTVKV